MAECPNKDCQKRQDGHHVTLYGESGRGGIVACVGKMVSRGFLMWSAAGLFALFGIVYEVYSRGQDEQNEKINSTYCTKEKYHEVNGKIIKLQSELEHIRKTTDDLKTNSKAVLRILERMELKADNAGDD